MATGRAQAWVFLIVTGVALASVLACTERVPTTPASPSPVPSPTPVPAPAPALDCTYQLSITNRAHTSGAEQGSVFVTTPASCPWTASTETNWIRIVSGNTSAGSGDVVWTVEANTGPARTGTITVAQRSVTITQGAPSPSPYDGAWFGSGQGSSSVSTPVVIEFTFQVTDGIIATSELRWRIDPVPGTNQPGCTAFTLPPSTRIIAGTFFTSFRSSTLPYSYVIRGTFTSPRTVTGMVEITPLEGAQPSCVRAMLNWTGMKQ
jgi:hypothetical protein